MNRVFTFIPILTSGILLGSSALAQVSQVRDEVSPKLVQVDERTLKADKHLVSGFSARASQGNVHVVVEIPAGTNAKWEVDSEDGLLKWDIKDGELRVVQYLSYPGNYGMIPSTVLAKDRGGDGDPLDVLLLGPALPRGAVVQAKIIGVLKFLDTGEQDDKLIAVSPGAVLGNVRDLDELGQRFPGVVQIIETWFANYKGSGVMQSRGKGNAAEANAILDKAIEMFEARHAVAK